MLLLGPKALVLYSWQTCNTQQMLGYQLETPLISFRFLHGVIVYCQIMHFMGDPRGRYSSLGAGTLGLIISSARATSNWSALTSHDRGTVKGARYLSKSMLIQWLVQSLTRAGWHFLPIKPSMCSLSLLCGNFVSSVLESWLVRGREEPLPPERTA